MIKCHDQANSVAAWDAMSEYTGKYRGGLRIVNYSTTKHDHRSMVNGIDRRTVTMKLLDSLQWIRKLMKPPVTTNISDRLKIDAKTWWIMTRYPGHTVTYCFTSTTRGVRNCHPYWLLLRESPDHLGVPKFTCGCAIKSLLTQYISRFDQGFNALATAKGLEGHACGTSELPFGHGSP